MLKNLKEFENKPPQYWEFVFLSGFHGKSPDAFYRIKIEKNDATCDACKNMDNRYFQKSEAVKGKNFPPFHQNCRCRAVDKDGKQVVLLSKEFIDSMMKSYGFSAKEGLKYIEEDLNTVDRGAHYLSQTFKSMGNFIWESTEDLLSDSKAYLISKFVYDENRKERLIKLLKDSKNANKVFYEDEQKDRDGREFIKDISTKFLNYLKEGMSK